jgi:hypothetical protein
MRQHLDKVEEALNTLVTNATLSEARLSDSLAAGPMATATKGIR